MKNPRGYIYKAFKAALSGITYNGNPVEVYSVPPIKPSNPYIQINNIITSNYDDKCTFSYLCDIDIEVVSHRKGGYQAPDVAEDVSNLVTEALLPTRAATIPINEFNMVALYHSNQINDQSLFDSNRGYRVINTFSFILDEEFDFSSCWLAGGTWSSNGVWGKQCIWNAGT